MQEVKLMNFGIENEYQEFKESLAQLDKAIKSLTAMVNKNGRGTIYFGVNDNGDVVGLKLGKKYLDEIRDKISNFVQPQLLYKAEEKYDGNLLYIELTAEGNDIPYSFDGRYYIRNIRSDELMDNNMIRHAMSSSISDILKTSESELQDLKFNDLFNYFAANGVHPRYEQSFFESFGLVTSCGKFNKVAYLLSDNNTISLKVVRFSGTDKTAMSERTEYGNRSLLTGCRDILNYVRSLNVTRVDLSSGVRVETNLFDVESFKEAWINAVVHNDWIHMLSPSVFIYDDRIEVFSYGQIPFRLTLDQFYSGQSMPVNEALFRIFSISDFAEQSGHGIPTIVNKYSKNAFNISGSTILVTLPFAFVPDSVSARKVREIESANLKETHRKILDYLLNNPNSSLEEVAKHVGLSVSGVKKIVASLQESGFIKRVGPKKGGHWSR